MNVTLKGIAATGTSAIALVLVGCQGDDGSKAATSRTQAATSASFAPTACGTFSGRGCAPKSQRVDLARPTFSHSTEITNPLYPISRLRSALLLGHVDGKPFRTETTLLPGTRIVSWDGRQIRVLVSQYVAYLDGRLQEVAIDRFAQADDGSVWYLGEDVFDYENGTVGVTEGTWLAGREGPAAMIMPGKPRVGEVYRPENVPGIVFEEVTVKAVGRKLDGPRGPVAGAIVTEELHLDGSREDKIFAPGYGEFRTGSGPGGDLEAIALAVPVDARSGPTPAAVTLLSTSASGILESARLEDWEAVSATLERAKAAWAAVRRDRPPPMVAALLGSTLRRLTRAAEAERPHAAAQAAIDVAQSALDLELRHRPQTEIDAARFELHTQQLRVHAAAKDLAGATGEVAALEWIRDRFAHTLEPRDRRELDSRLRGLRAATDARNLPAAADHAARLGARLRSLVRPRAAG